MECLDEAAVLAWCERRSVQDLTETARHLDTCAVCLELVAELSRNEIDPASRYELGDEIARGGMGRVIAATDRLLGRSVALKTVRVPVAALERRFAREMRITARLQHPAIVPIYDAGTLPSGEPFYAMRRIGGRTLDREIAAAATLTERLALLPAVTTVANAMAYAHGEGVIHRDLKPHNIVIERFGETIVIDWGLAKDLRSTAPDLDVPIVPVQGSVTLDGDVVGTPGYMAPEQRAGGVVDERSDVYGIGAVLYHVLAGAPPLPSRADAAAAIVPIATRQPDVPADLAAIVTRALAVDPAERYPSAAELVADLRQFEAGALVSSHRYSLGELVKKWLVRHRVALAVASVAVTIIVALSIVGVRRIISGRAIAEAARNDAEQQRDAAEVLIDFMLHDLRDRLEQVGRVDALEGVGAEVESYYAKRAPRGKADLTRRAGALGVLADARLASGDLDAALAADRSAVAAALSAGNDDATCRARQRLGDVLRARGELAAAAGEYHGCELIARAHSAADPAWTTLLAGSLSELAAIARSRGDFDVAAKTAAAAARTVESVPGDSALQVWLRATDYSGQIALDRGDLEGAATALRRGVDRARVAYEARPADPELRGLYCNASIEIGRVELRRGDLAAAERAFTTGRDLSQLLVDRDPANAQSLNNLGSSYDFLAKLAMARAKPVDALELAQSGLAIARRLAKLAPNNAEWARGLSASDITITAIQRALGHLDLARVPCRESVAIEERLLAGDPGNAETIRDLATDLVNLGDLELARGDIAAARTALERSATLQRGLLAKQDAPRTRRELAMILLVLSDALAKTDHAGSRHAIEEARDVVAPIRALAASDADLRETLGEVDDALGKH